MTQETTIDVQKAYWWTQNKRGDWRAKYRRTSVVKRRAYLTYRSLINSGKLKPPTKWPVHVTAIIHPLTHGRFDPENAAPMVKAILDAITQSGYWPDDNADYVQSYNDLSYRRRPASEILWAMVKANGKRTN